MMKLPNAPILRYFQPADKGMQTASDFGKKGEVQDYFQYIGVGSNNFELWNCGRKMLTIFE